MSTIHVSVDTWEGLLRPHVAKFRSAYAGGLTLTLEPESCDVLGRLMLHMAMSLDVLGFQPSNNLPASPLPPHDGE